MVRKIREGFEWQISACRALGSPLTADVLTAVLAALDRTTQTGKLILGWPGDPKNDALMLRVTGGLNALARSGQDAGLTALYAAQSGDWEREIRRVLAHWDDWLVPWLDNAPQTNEVARSGVLFPGVMEIARRFGPRLELLELGASAGLNLNMDRFAYRLGATMAGESLSPVWIEPEWRGASIEPCSVNVIGRRGVDLNPLDVAVETTAETLMAYIWPDQSERVARAAAAIKVARQNPIHVDTANGSDWLVLRLAETQSANTTRIIYHSIALQYFSDEARRQVEKTIEAAGAAATPEHPLAWLSMEFPSVQQNVQLTLRCWPGSGERELLATCHPHGAWVHWKGS